MQNTADVECISISLLVLLLSCSPPLNPPLLTPSLSGAQGEDWKRGNPDWRKSARLFHLLKSTFPVFDLSFSSEPPAPSAPPWSSLLRLLLPIVFAWLRAPGWRYTGLLLQEVLEKCTMCITLIFVFLSPQSFDYRKTILKSLKDRIFSEEMQLTCPHVKVMNWVHPVMKKMTKLYSILSNV